MNAVTLNPDEEILARERLHRGIFAIPVILFVLTLIPVALVSILLWLMHSAVNPNGSFAWILIPLLLVPCLPALITFVTIWIAYANSEVTLTNRRLLFRAGLLIRTSGELSLEHVEGITVMQGLLGRLCGFGAIFVSTTGGVQYPLHYIGKPETFRTLLQQAVAASKRAPVPSTSYEPPAPSEDDSRYMPQG